MAAERRYIDLEDKPDLNVLVDEATRTRSGVVLRRGGRVVAIVEAAPAIAFQDERDRSDMLTETSGAWIGLVNPTDLANRVERRLETRPPAKFD